MEQRTYFIQNRRNGYVKVGVSKSVYCRERTLQAQEPEIELIGYFSTGIDLENYIHSAWSDHRLRGEWFDVSKPQLEGMIYHVTTALETDNGEFIYYEAIDEYKTPDHLSGYDAQEEIITELKKQLDIANEKLTEANEMAENLRAKNRFLEREMEVYKNSPIIATCDTFVDYKKKATAEGEAITNKPAVKRNLRQRAMAVAAVLCEIAMEDNPYCTVQSVYEITPSYS